jgi:aspartate/methionine/tyrosine aminotransferase
MGRVPSKTGYHPLIRFEPAAMSDSPHLSAIRPEIQSLPESGIVRIANYARETKDFVPLWFGEGDLPTPAFINEAATEALNKGQTFYTYQRGIPPLRAALGEYLSRIYATPVSHERIFLTVGGMQAIMQTMQMLIGPGDEIVVPGPVWPNIFHAAHIQGGVTKHVKVGYGNAGWTLDLEQLFQAVTAKTKAIFINSPGNPTGYVLTQDEMRAILEFARARGIWIISDEVYGQFNWEGPREGGGPAPSMLQIADPEDRVIVVNTFSKMWSMTGWRIGWLVAPQSMGQVYENLIQYNTSGVPTFLQYGALAAIEQGDDYVASIIERARIARDMVTDALGSLPKVRYSPPKGAFYAFFSVDGYEDGDALAYKLVDDGNVGLAPGSAFGPGGEGYVRLCFACSHEMLAKGLERVTKVLG